LWFSRCRDIFRDKVTESNPGRFPRGRQPAPVDDILQRIFGAEPLARQRLVCIGCGTEKHDSRSSAFLPYAFNLNLLRRGQDPKIIPLQLAITRFIEKYTVEPTSSHSQCRVCQAAQQVICRMPRGYGLRFKRARGPYSLPSKSITLHNEYTLFRLSSTLEASTLPLAYARGRVRGGIMTVCASSVNHSWKLSRPRRSFLSAMVGTSQS